MTLLLFHTKKVWYPVPRLLLHINLLSILPVRVGGSLEFVAIQNIAHKANEEDDEYTKKVCHDGNWW